MDNRQLVRDAIYSIVEGSSEVPSEWGEHGFFVVEIVCKGAAGDEIELSVDCDGGENGGKNGVGIDDCALLNKEISARLIEILPGTTTANGEEEEPDFSLTVMSAGLGQPMRLGRQYQKLMQTVLMRGDDSLPLVDVLFKDGRKLTGVVLCGIGYDNAEVEADLPNAIEVVYQVREQMPDHPKKKYQIVERREQIALAETKAVTEHFDFK